VTRETVQADQDILSYYNARANEYEKVYAKPERQDDLRQLHRIVPACLAGRRVLEVACGTGYWTRLIAAEAASVTGCDLADDVLAVARAQQPANTRAAFTRGDAFDLTGIAGEFDAAFVGFWWSHVLRVDLRRFLDGLHRRLLSGSRVLIVDNRYIPGSNWPITRTDADGNTYQRRVLESGAEYEVLKNFPSADEVRDAVASTGGESPVVHELGYYWYVIYSVPGVV